jgi:hydroxymethylpyrimidine/phosphomethylpyrimidine kinase
MTATCPVQPPVVLVLAGLDPTGGAGLAADVATIGRMGAHAAPVACCLTVQDTRDVLRLEPVPAALITAQARAVLDDLPVAAIKIGLLGSAEAAAAVAALLRGRRDLPVVLDPILRAGGGAPLADARLLDILRCELLPLATIMTPNTPEARALSGQHSADDCATALLAAGARAVLLTGGHEPDAEVHNRLYQYGQEPHEWRWPRLPGSYHGSGCTLAAALAAGLAHGRTLAAAAEAAQQFTWQALASGFAAGRGQRLPQRFFAGAG